jgi:hypothetical protein
VVECGRGDHAVGTVSSWWGQCSTLCIALHLPHLLPSVLTRAIFLMSAPMFHLIM